MPIVARHALHTWNLSMISSQTIKHIRENEREQIHGYYMIAMIRRIFLGSILEGRWCRTRPSPTSLALNASLRGGAVTGRVGNAVDQKGSSALRNLCLKGPAGNKEMEWWQQIPEYHGWSKELSALFVKMKNTKGSSLSKISVALVNGDVTVPSGNTLGLMDFQDELKLYHFLKEYNIYDSKASLLDEKHWRGFFNICLWNIREC